MASIPAQKVSLAQKQAKQFEHIKKTIDAVIDQSQFNSKDMEKMRKCENAYFGTIDGSDYSYITNPYNTKEKKYQKFPAKLRNYNILKPVIDLLLGEKRKRKIDYQVVTLGDNPINRKNSERTEVISAFLQQLYINEMNAQGAETGQETKELPELDEFMTKWETDYQDARALLGQEILDIAFVDTDAEEKFREGFFNWLVFGRVYTYKGAHNHDPVYDVVHPMDLSFHRTPNVKFIQDCDWVVRRSQMSGHQLMDRFYEELQGDIDKIDHDPQTGTGHHDWNTVSLHHYNDINEENVYTVFHASFKTFSRVGFVAFVDPESGIEQEIEVDESYDGPEDVEWIWVNEIWEGYKVTDNKDNFYFNIGPVENARGTIDNPSECKHNYNGRLVSESPEHFTSPLWDGLPYQILYNVFHYLFEKVVGKNKDKISLLDINMIPRKYGWDEDKFMYYADAMGFAWVDSAPETQGENKPTFNQYQVLDMSVAQSIQAHLQMLQIIKSEWEETLGINRQRKGQAAASDGASVTERAVFQSSMITEDLFARFDKFEEEELRGILEMARMAWSEGKRGSYITPDFKQVIYDIHADDLSDEDLGVFVRMDAKSNENLDMMRELSLTFAQNGATPTTIAEIIDARNMSQVKAQLRKFDKEMAEQQQQQAMLQEEAIAAEQAKDEREKAHLANEAELDRIHEKELEEMRITGAIIKDEKEEKAEDKSASEKEKHEMKTKDKEQARKDKELNLDRQEFNLKKQSEKTAEKLKREELAIKRAAARKSKNT